MATQFIRRFNNFKASLTENEKKVLAKLEKAAELIAPIYGAQINDKYPGANFYPHDATKEEVLREAHNNSLILSPYTVVERDGKGQLIAIPYHIKYATQLKPVIKLLRQAAAITDNKEFTKRLEVQADALENGSYEAADIYWLSMKPNKIDLTIGPIERYEDSLLFIKTCYTATVGVLNEESTKKAIELRDAMLSSQRKAFSLASRVEIHNRQSRFDHTVVIAGFAARSLFSGYSLPNDPHLMEKYGVKVMILKDVVRHNFDVSHYPIFKKIFEKKFQQGYTPEILLDASEKLIFLRQVTANSVRYHDTEARLGESAPIIEEVASYVLAVKSAGMLLLKDEISQKELEGMIIMLICRAFDFFIESKTNKGLIYYSQGYSIMINYFIENGALQEYNGLSWVNFTKVFMGLNDLAVIMEKILALGDVEDVRRLVRQYDNYNNCLRLVPKL